MQRIYKNVWKNDRGLYVTHPDGGDPKEWSKVFTIYGSVKGGIVCIKPSYNENSAIYRYCINNKSRNYFGTAQDVMWKEDISTEVYSTFFYHVNLSKLEKDLIPLFLQEMSEIVPSFADLIKTVVVDNSYKYLELSNGMKTHFITNVCGDKAVDCLEI